MDELEAIKVTFFQECEELLADLEGGLLAMQEGVGDIETVNAVFRAVHSIKGGAATFGFSDLAELTHVLETLLDRLRRHELAPTPPMVDTLLASGDALREMTQPARGTVHASGKRDGVTSMTYAGPTAGSPAGPVKSCRRAPSRSAPPAAPPTPSSSPRPSRPSRKAWTWPSC